MKVRTLALCFLILLFVSCTPAAPASPTPTPASTQTHTPSPTPSSTPRPRSLVIAGTCVYAGPDQAGFSVLAELNIGGEVMPVGRYGDFVKVEFEDEGEVIKGYVAASSLEAIPDELEDLHASDIPWISVDLANLYSIHPIASFTDDMVVLDNTQHDGFDDYLVTSLQMSSPFRLSSQIETNSNEYGSIKLADSPNITEGDWWRGIHRIDLATSDGRLQIDLRDGVASDSIQTIYLNKPDTRTVIITFLDPQGKRLQVTDKAGTSILDMDVTEYPDLEFPNGLFPEGLVYFGRVVAPDSRLAVRDLSLEILPPGTWDKGQECTAPPTMHELASELGLDLGTEFQWWRMSDPRYEGLVLSEYDVLVLSDFSLQDFWIGPDEYDFKSVDAIVDWALRNGFRVRASHLVWGADDAIPPWLKNGYYSRDETIEILENHVKTVMNHYRGRITEWSIANEAVNRAYYPGNDFWADRIGMDYINMVFRWARETDPDAILIFNNDNNEAPRDAQSRLNVERTYAILENLKEDDIPIDVIGMQMHLFLPWNNQIPPTKEVVIETMRAFAELGVSIYITEFDINLQWFEGSRDERWAFQSQLYSDIFTACIDSGVCTNITFWGVSDSTSWLSCNDQDWCQNFPQSDPLIFDLDYLPKPAYFSILDVLGSVDSALP